MNRKISRIVISSLMVILVAAVMGGVWNILDLNKTFGLEKQPDYTPVLMAGTQGSLVAYQATDDECNRSPLIMDVRSQDDPSLSVIPRLAQSEYNRLQSFYKFQPLSQYGCNAAKPGEKYWDLYAIEFKCGPAVLQPQVLYEDGSPITDKGILMFLSWPGAEQFPVAISPSYAQNGAWGFTSNGNIGWGYAGESHIGTDGGPYLAWPSADPESLPNRVKYGDGLSKIGWWDNHCTPNPIFRITVKEGSAPPPSGDGYRLVDIDETGNIVGFLPFIEDVPSEAGYPMLGLYLDDQMLGYMIWEK